MPYTTLRDLQNKPAPRGPHTTNYATYENLLGLVVWWIQEFFASCFRPPRLTPDSKQFVAIQFAHVGGGQSARTLFDTGNLGPASVMSQALWYKFNATLDTSTPLTFAGAENLLGGSGQGGADVIYLQSGTVPLTVEGVTVDVPIAVSSGTMKCFDLVVNLGTIQKLIRNGLTFNP